MGCGVGARTVWHFSTRDEWGLEVGKKYGKGTLGIRDNSGDAV